MTSPQDLSRTTSFASTRSQDSTSSQNAAALRGATTAFGRPTASGRVPNTNKPNGALAAATSVGSSPARPLVPVSTGDSVQGTGNYAARDLNLSSTSNMSTPNLPPPPSRGQSKSPSHQAASLATARAPPPSIQTSTPANSNGNTRTASIKSPAVPPKPRRLSSYTKPIQQEDTEKPTDSTSIAPTTSLVNMFERKASSPQATRKEPDTIVVKPDSQMPVKSPKPVKPSSGITSMISMELQNAKSTPSPEALDFAQSHPRATPNTDGTSYDESTVPPRKPLAADNPPMPPPRKREPFNIPDTARLEPVKSPNPPRGRPGPPPSPLRSQTTDPIPISRSEKPATSPTDTVSPSSASVKSVTAQYNLLHPQRMTANLTSDRLADAMVAGSLASSRQNSPARAMDPPPLPTRRHKHTFSLSRTPSPAKAGLKKTLRQTQSDTDDDEDDERLYPHGKHKLQKRLGKHPHKHHEGDRKRWRESVAEHERKRYEGVWAANKGLYCSFTPSEAELVSRSPQSQEVRDLQDAIGEQVSNVVVRDIWSRSRLPDAVLETVWDLVDNERVGRLRKEEFVLGLWLIDGRLKGKKLPVKVSESVWRSVKGVQKIKIRR